MKAATSLFACLFVLLGALGLADELTQHSAIVLPSGAQHPVYLLAHHEAVAAPTLVTALVKPQEDNLAKFSGMRYPTSDRAFFVLPVNKPGYYLISGGFGVYEELSQISGAGVSYSDMTVLPVTDKRCPETYIFRSEAGQTWATQILMPGDLWQHTRSGYEAPEKTYRIGAISAGLLEAGQDFTANLADKVPAALFELAAEPGQGYHLALTTAGDADYDLFLLRSAGPAATRIVEASQSRTIGAQEVAEQIWFKPVAGRTYLALVRLVSGSGDFSLSFSQLAGPLPAAQWTVIKDDDGEKDSFWGQVCSSTAALFKELVVPDDPANIARVMLQYEMGVAPYDPQSQKHLDRGAPADKQWCDLVISLNDTVILQRPLDEVAGVGWHEAAFDAALLVRGTNVFKFTLAPGGNDYFYMCIDLNSAYDRSYCAINGKIDRTTLRPAVNRHVGPGEYMVRIKYQKK